ncbi:MAG: AbrB/MazE/SpoVT family DNA-binding domain-containing protein [Propionibacteriaceae bacterium]|jgi:AbrB family looped-hinge helix DNA binding protein|nr:AbrB/MazE/SpoVT family DNA-binding domain-containing protein [Propionibacteriaceae bacterium]
MPIAVMSSKGQIVIPAEVRQAADLNSGDRIMVDYDPASQELRLRKTPSAGEVIDELSAKVGSWISPGTVPLTDPRAFYRTRAPRN